LEKSLVILSILLVSLLACSKKKTVNAGSPGLDYYPTSEGKFVVYDVDSTIYTDLPVDTIYYRYRIKEKIADSFTDNEGQPATRLERYIKKFNPLVSYDSIPWILKEVWLVNAGKKNIQVAENNIRYTKLIFPVVEKAVWNGNAYNTKGEWLYTYEFTDKKETINKQALEKVLQVTQKDFRTLISYQRYTEKYAAGIGLVQREITDILSNRIVAGLPVEGRIETGLIYKQTLVNYGYE
jgi:hypothetical protein